MYQKLLQQSHSSLRRHRRPFLKNHNNKYDNKFNRLVYIKLSEKKQIYWHLVHGCQDLLCDLLTTGKIVIAIRKNFRFHDRHDPGALADGSVTGQHVGILQDGKLARCVFRDLQHTSPFGEVAAIFLVLDATRLKIIETLSGALIVCAEKWNNTLVNLDAGNNVALLQKFNKRRAVFGFLIKGFVEEDHSGDVLPDNILRRSILVLIAGRCC